MKVGVYAGMAGKYQAWLLHDGKIYLTTHMVSGKYRYFDTDNWCYPIGWSTPPGESIYDKLPIIPATKGARFKERLNDIERHYHVPFANPILYIGLEYMAFVSSDMKIAAVYPNESGQTFSNVPDILAHTGTSIKFKESGLDSPVYSVGFKWHFKYNTVDRLIDGHKGDLLITESLSEQLAYGHLFVGQTVQVNKALNRVMLDMGEYKLISLITKKKVEGCAGMRRVYIKA